MHESVPAMTDVVTKQCPECGRTITGDRRFVIWCEDCNWNVDAGATPETSERLRHRAEKARTRGQRLYEELRDKALDRPLASGSRTASLVLAVAILGAAVAILALGVFIVATNFLTVFAVLVGIPLVLLGLLLRPRLGKLRRGTVVLPPETAPVLYGLVNRVAEQMGAKPVDLIAVTPAFNASHGQIGLRRRRVLWVGLALWNALTAQEQVAILAHELGHQVNGDLTQGTVVGSALRTLAELEDVLRVRPGRPRPTGSLFEALEALARLLAELAMRAMGIVVIGLFNLEKELVFRSQQRAEYFADALSARVASTAAAIACLDRCYLARQATQAVYFAARHADDGVKPDIWAAELRYLDEMSEMEWERLRRLNSRDGTAIDSNHPPTNLRIEMLKQQPVEPGRITLSVQEARSISAELASGYDLVADLLMASLAG